MSVRVLVIGGGAAGASCCYSLGRFSDKVYVECWDSQSEPGGVAQSVVLPSGEFINDGVQGGSLAYANTQLLHSKLGFSTHQVELTISFLTGDNHWSNVGEKSKLIAQLQGEIKSFGLLLKGISEKEFLYAFFSITTILKLFRYSEEFINYMVLPLVALFFGTGNQTHRVPAVIVARVFHDEDYRLFEYSASRLLDSAPIMFSFGNLQDVYRKIFRVSGAVLKVNQTAKSVKFEANGKSVLVTDSTNQEFRFDHVVFAVSAENALKLIQNPSWMERIVLGNVEYYDDVTVTHTDNEYMQKYYEKDQLDAMYMIRSIESSKFEMSFCLTAYQPHLKRKIFQTIFLDGSTQSTWSMSEISPKHILLTKWWRQFSATVRHLIFTVPLLRFIQGGKSGRLYFCGSWCLANTHEIANISGSSAAWRILTEHCNVDSSLAYPWSNASLDAERNANKDTTSDIGGIAKPERLKLAQKQFSFFLWLSHGKSFESSNRNLLPLLITIPVVLSIFRYFY
jgi:predicted NAD/FAD-binding protein